MLFLFRGRNGPAVRAIVGALLLAAGIAIHGAAILAGIGAVLLAWGVIGVLSSRRAARSGHLGSSGRTP
jgi:hypothetical protein